MMKVIAMKLNPAFKRTQPLPMLTADFAKRASRAARSIALALPVASAWHVVTANAASRRVKTHLNLPAVV